MNIEFDTLTKYRTWEEIPDYLKTKTALGREGKKPGGAPVGRIFQYASTRWIMLYDEKEAVPKRKISDVIHSVSKSYKNDDGEYVSIYRC